MATDCAKPNLEEVSKFNRDSLKKSDTQEKSGAVAGYAQEKTLEQVGKFDKTALKHVDTQEKNPLPSQAEIEAEKSSGF